jgi:hypothetical protein
MCGPANAIAGKYANSFQIITKKRVYYMYGSSRQEMNRWKEALLLNGAKWEETLQQNTTIFVDGAVQSDLEDESVELQRLYKLYREASSPDARRAFKASTVDSDTHEQQELELPNLPTLESILNAISMLTFQDIKFLAESFDDNTGELLFRSNDEPITHGGRALFQDEEGTWKLISEEWRGISFLLGRSINFMHKGVVEGNYRTVGQFCLRFSVI